MTNELQSQIIPLGNSGIYIDGKTIANNLYDWAENTSTEVKRNQIETVALALAAVSIIALIIVAATRN